MARTAWDVQAEALPPNIEPSTTGQIPFTFPARRVLELSLREALSLGHNYIGTEHLLMGLVRYQECEGMRILTTILELDQKQVAIVIWPWLS